MVGVVRKIIAEATGIKTESRMPPLIEFFGPEVVKVCVCVVSVESPPSDVM